MRTDAERWDMVLEYYPDLCKWTTKTASEHGLEFADLHSYVIESVFRATKSWRPDGGAGWRSWMYRAARTGLTTYLRAAFGKKGVREPFHPSRAPWPSDEEHPLDPAEEDHQYDIVDGLDAVERLLPELDLTARQDFVARSLASGWKAFELADHLGVHKTAIAHTVRQVRQKMEAAA